MIRTILLFFLLLFLACKHDDRSKAVRGDNIELDISLKQLMIKYINYEPCEDCIYEVYIDKKSPDNYQVILYKGSNSLTFEEYIKKKKYPLFYTYVSNKKVYVYSGAENYFSVKDPLILQGGKNKTDKTFKVWVLSDSLGVKKLDTFNQVYPFFQLPEKRIFKPN